MTKIKQRQSDSVCERVRELDRERETESEMKKVRER